MKPHGAGEARIYIGLLRLTEEEHATLKRLAGEQRRSIAEVCRWAIRRGLAK